MVVDLGVGAVRCAEDRIGSGIPNTTERVALASGLSFAPMTMVYHLARASEWSAARADGVYRGSADDRRDGFLHFSTAEQIVVSAAKHRAGERDLVLLAVPAEALGAELRWEPSRGGALFPHLYGSLPLDAVDRAVPLPLGADGAHVFPPLS